MHEVSTNFVVCETDPCCASISIRPPPIPSFPLLFSFPQFAKSIISNLFKSSFEDCPLGNKKDENWKEQRIAQSKQKPFGKQGRKQRTAAHFFSVSSNISMNEMRIEPEEIQSRNQEERRKEQEKDIRKRLGIRKEEVSRKAERFRKRSRASQQEESGRKAKQSTARAAAVRFGRRGKFGVSRPREQSVSKRPCGGSRA